MGFRVKFFKGLKCSLNGTTKDILIQCYAKYENFFPNLILRYFDNLSIGIFKCSRLHTSLISNDIENSLLVAQCSVLVC